MRKAVVLGLVLLAGCGQKAAKPDMVTDDFKGSLTDPPPPVPEHPVPQPAQKPAPAPPSTEPGALPAQPPQHFQALGTEPFWSFEVLSGKLIYSSPEIQQGMVIATRFSGEGKRLLFSGTMRGKAVVLTIEPGTCSDGMSDTVYAYKATFRWGEQIERGCARLK